MNGLTARLALDLMGLRPGQVLAVTGAAGRLRRLRRPAGQADGLTVVADASEADEQLVRDLGADVVVRRGDDVAARIRERFPDGVDGLADGAVQDALVLPPCGTAGRWRPAAATGVTARAGSGCTRRWCGGSRRTGPRWTASGSRPSRAC
jgi:hypothetical protein